MHIKGKNIKSKLREAQISVLSEKIDKLFNILCKFGPLIGPLSYKFGLFKICKKMLNNLSIFSDNAEIWASGGNFLCSFLWCSLFGPRRLFEVTEVVMSFSQKQRPRLGIWIQKKNVLNAFLLYFCLLYTSPSPRD